MNVGKKGLFAGDVEYVDLVPADAMAAMVETAVGTTIPKGALRTIIREICSRLKS